MDYKAILNLMKEMNQTELTKLEIESDGVRITMEKGIPAAFSVPSVIAPQISAPVVSGCAVPEIVKASSNSENQPAEKVNGLKVLSPMVGTYYSQPSPEKPAFVKVGDKVKKGQTLCIIEAMKLMNEIESEYDGEIVEVLVDNEDMVEFGQPLFIIK